MNRPRCVSGAAVLCALVAVVLSGCARQAPPEAPAKGAPAAQSVTPPVPGGPTVASLIEKHKQVKSYALVIKGAQGEPVKQKYLTEGGHIAKLWSEVAGGWVLIDAPGRVLYRYDAATKVAQKRELTEPVNVAGLRVEFAVPVPIFDLGMLPADTPLTESEQIGGVKCWVLKAQMGDGKAWVEADTGLLRKVSVAGKTIEYTVSETNKVPASAFEVPRGVKVEPMPPR